MSKSNVAEKVVVENNGATDNKVNSAVETPAVVVPTIDLSKYASLTSKSAKMRAMAADGFSRGAIAKALGVRYQHVRNVLIVPLKRAQG
jgi:hypothetical protein